MLNYFQKGGTLMSVYSDNYNYLLSKMNHELRNPMALVYSTLQLIETQHPETKDFKHWSELRSDIEYMIQLLEEFSSFNSSEHLHKTDFSSYDFLSKICLSFAASLVEEHIIFSSKIPENLPFIFADKLKLQEVILNLLKNAREALVNHGFIYLESFTKNNQLIIQISDTGCGISEEYIESIFDPFVTHKSSGTGLGLAISKRIIDAHGGEIHIDTVMGEGTCLTITLPL